MLGFIWYDSVPLSQKTDVILIFNITYYNNLDRFLSAHISFSSSLRWFSMETNHAKVKQTFNLDI